MAVGTTPKTETMKGRAVMNMATKGSTTRIDAIAAGWPGMSTIQQPPDIRILKVGSPALLSLLEPLLASLRERH